MRLQEGNLPLYLLPCATDIVQCVYYEIGFSVEHNFRIGKSSIATGVSSYITVYYCHPTFQHPSTIATAIQLHMSFQDTVGNPELESSGATS